MFKVGDLVKWRDLGLYRCSACNPHNIGIVKKIKNKNKVYILWLKCKSKQCLSKHICFEYSHRLDLALTKVEDNV